MRKWLRFLIAAGIILVSSLAAIAIHNSRFGQRLEQGTYDLRFRLRGPLPPFDGVPITVIAVDEESFDRLGPGSGPQGRPLIFWHGFFAELIGQLVDAGAAAVGLDFILTDIEPWYPEEQKELVRTLLLAQAQGVPVILGFRGGSEEAVDDMPLQLVIGAGEDGFAFVNLTTDTDDFVRRQELKDAAGETGFALAIAQAAAGADQELAYVPLPGNPRTILINFRNIDAFETIPFWQAKEAAERADQAFFESLAGHIVLIGEIAEGDRHATPLYYWVNREETRQMARTPGILVHANTITTLLEGNFIREADPSTQWLIVLVITSAVVGFSFRLAPALSVGLSIALLAGFLSFSILLFNRGLWLFWVAPLLGTFLGGSVSQVANYVLEGREKRQLRSLFRRYVDDQVIEKILKTESLSLVGERKRISVLFSDIRNFTTRSESMAPENLVSLLNRYFEQMVGVIQGHKGTVDKFMGDGIMAIFGAPLDDPECGFNAVQAGLEMLKRLDKLNEELSEEGIEPIQIGIGIHTGYAIVGNIGSPQKLEYTAIGDVVNTASRIEGLNKKFGYPLLISGETLKEIEGRVNAQFLGDEAVKGKTVKLAVYRVQSGPVGVAAGFNPEPTPA